MPTLTVYSPTLTAVATIPDVYGPAAGAPSGADSLPLRLDVSGKHAPGTYASLMGVDTRSWWHITAWTYTPSNADGHNSTRYTPTEGLTTYTLTRLGDDASDFSALADAITNDRNTNQAHTIDNNITYRGLGDIKPDTIKRMNKAITNQH